MPEILPPSPLKERKFNQRSGVYLFFLNIKLLMFWKKLRGIISSFLPFISLGGSPWQPNRLLLFILNSIDFFFCFCLFVKRIPRKRRPGEKEDQIVESSHLFRILSPLLFINVCYRPESFNAFNNSSSFGRFRNQISRRGKFK